MSLTETDLQKHLSIVHAKAPGQIYGFFDDGKAPIPDTLIVGVQTWRIVRARSPLAVRAAMLERAEGELLAVLTPLTTRQLGDDLRSRFAAQRLFEFDPWESVATLFGAMSVDGRLRHDRELGQALLRYAPDAGYPAVPAGVLEPTTAWNALFQVAFDSPSPPESVADWIAWLVETPRRATRLVDLHALLGDSLVERLEVQFGPAVGLMLSIVRHSASNGQAPAGHLLLLGAAYDTSLRAIASGQEPWKEEGAVFRARLEKYVGSGEKPTLAAIEHYAHEAERARRKSSLAGLAADLDRLLEAEASEGIARFSDVSPRGWKQRLQDFAHRLVAVAGGDGGLDLLEAGIESLERHECAAAEPEIFSIAEAAARLAGALADEGAGAHDEADDLDVMARRYIEQGSWHDRLRESLTLGDVGAILSPAVEALLAIALERSDTRNEAFSLRLASTLKLQPAAKGTLPIHRVLDEVVAPLAAQHPVALLVLDGMSWAVARALLADPWLESWDAWAPSHDGALLPMFATVPSATEFSRTSLLTGTLQRGNQKLEKELFVQHPGLRSAIGNSKKMALFHKAELDASGRGNVGADVAAALADPQHRVVGVVVNAIDDQLGGGSQVSIDWMMKTITPLRSLLQQADEANRVVVLTSDHGHVWELGSERTVDGSSARYRSGREDLIEGERVFEGELLENLTGQAHLVAAWSERVRYTRGKRGYHGGASMQEVITPLVVLSSADDDLSGSGLARFSTAAPSWWAFGDEELPDVSAIEAPAVAPPQEKENEKKPEAQLDLLSLSEPIPTSARPAWINQLLDSDVFRGRMEAATLVGERELVVLLMLLDINDGRAHLNAIANVFRVNKGRAPRYITAIKDVLNREGYQVLDFNRAEQMVRLDAGLLRSQYGVVAS